MIPSLLESAKILEEKAEKGHQNPPTHGVKPTGSITSALALLASFVLPSHAMSKKIFVGNIPFSMTDQDLSDAFTHVGQVVSAHVITNRMTGRSKGYGFVEMNTDEEAASAIAQLDGADFNGRTVTVHEAKSEEPRKEHPPRRREDRKRKDQAPAENAEQSASAPETPSPEGTAAPESPADNNPSGAPSEEPPANGETSTG